MSPRRIASILMLLWTLIQVWYLEALDYGPSGHVIAWLICAVIAGVSVGLWFGTPWSRVSGLAIATAFIIFYVAVLYRFGARCVDDLVVCYTRTLSQPLLMVVALVVLIWRPASNNRMERPRER